MTATSSGTVEPFTRDAHGKPALSAAPADLYAFGSLVRHCELRLLEMFTRNLVSGTLHTCLGQELCQIAAVRALDRSRDAVFSNHRCHGHFLAYTGAFDGLIGELLGREAGVRGGHGGSQHLSCPGFVSSGVQAGLSAIAVGHARANRPNGGIAVLIVGDGTFGEGLLYESMNLAAVWRAPVLFVVEDNGVAQSTPSAKTRAGSLAARGEAFDLPTWCLDDAAPSFPGDVEHIVHTIRSEGRPAMVIVRTQRLGPHSRDDGEWRYDDRLAAAALPDDPLSRLAAQLSAEEKRRIDADNGRFLDAVYEQVLGAAMSAPTARAPRRPVPPAIELGGDIPARSVRESLNGALRRLLRDDERVMLLGEDIEDPYGGAFKVTRGASTSWPDRVCSTPISEAALVGTGIGLAMAGRRPILEIMFADFLPLAADQLLNHAVKFDRLSPATDVPLVVRTAGGGGRGYGPTHSQSLEAFAAAIPGLTVVVPSHRHDAGALLERTVECWPHPTLFYEHKRLYQQPMDAGAYLEHPPDSRDEAAVLFPTMVRGRSHADVTFITFGGMLPVVEQAAARLEDEELSVQIIVPSLVSPFPAHTVQTLVAGVRRLVMVEEGPGPFGVGAEVGAMLLESGYRGLFARVGAPPDPIPAARTLEAAILPDADRIFELVSTLVTRPPGAGVW